ncbi:MAG: hypothetical protein RLZZ598_732 [Pseudomonadota bacterium]
MSHFLLYPPPIAARRKALQFTGNAPDGYEGDAYYHVYGLTGGKGPYTVTVNSGALPPGVTVSPTVPEGGSPTLTGTLPPTP